MAFFEGNNMTGGYGNGPDIISSCSVNVERGEIVSILGPNGAGKSTFINILADLAKKTSGEIEVLNINHESNLIEAKRLMGIVPQELNIDPFFTPYELLEIQAGLYGIKKKDRKTMEILEMLALEDKAKAYARTLSGGMRRRLLIAKAMVHDPEILILDEPTAGVSPIVMDKLFDHILKVKKTNVAILMVEQNAKQALSISDRGYVLVTGENRYSGTGKELLNDQRVRSSFLGA